jgi:hypothetical protein
MLETLDNLLTWLFVDAIPLAFIGIGIVAAFYALALIPLWKKGFSYLDASFGMLLVICLCYIFFLVKWMEPMDSEVDHVVIALLAVVFAGGPIYILKAIKVPFIFMFPIYLGFILKGA